MVIDNKDVAHSDMIFGNGVQVADDSGELDSWETREFIIALPISEFFPERRIYRLSWKGKNFQSEPITVQGGLPR